MTVSDSVEVAAPAEDLWAQIADPANMPRWSPENIGAPEGAGHTLKVGDVFNGRNKRGAAKWTTRCSVTAADPGKVFSFEVEAIGLKTPWLRGRIASWSYTFTPSATGTTVTETWTDLRKSWPDWVASIFDRVATRTPGFYVFQEKNIARTLANLKSDFEKQPTS